MPRPLARLQKPPFAESPLKLFTRRLTPRAPVAVEGENHRVLLVKNERDQQFVRVLLPLFANLSDRLSDERAVLRRLGPDYHHCIFRSIEKLHGFSGG